MALEVLQPSRDDASDADFTAALGRARMAGSGTIAFSKGVFLLRKEYVVPAGVALWFGEDASLLVAGSLELRGPIFADRTRIFRLWKGSSNVFIVEDPDAGQQVPEVTPRWWGAGPEDDGQALRAMGESLTDAGRVIISFDDLAYRTAGFEVPAGCYMRSVGLDGAPSEQRAVIQFVGDDQPLLRLTPPSDPESPLRLTTVEGLAFVGRRSSFDGSAGRPESEVLVDFRPRRQADINLVNCNFGNAVAGVRISGGVSAQLSGVETFGCERGAVWAKEPAPGISIGDPETVRRDQRVAVQWDGGAKDSGGVHLELPRRRVILQITNVLLGQRVHVVGGPSTRVWLVDSEVAEYLHVEAPEGLFLSEGTDYRLTSIRPGPLPVGLVLKGLDTAMIHNAKVEVGGVPLLASEGRVLEGPEATLIPGSSRPSQTLPGIEVKAVPFTVLLATAPKMRTRVHLHEVTVEADPDWPRSMSNVSAFALAGDGEGHDHDLVVSGGGVGGRATSCVLAGAGRIAITNGHQPSGPTARFLLSEEEAELILEGRASEFTRIEVERPPQLACISFRPVGAPSPPPRDDSGRSGPDDCMQGGRLLQMPREEALKVLSGATALAGFEGDQVYFEAGPDDLQLQDGFVVGMVCVVSDLVRATWKPSFVQVENC